MRDPLAESLRADLGCAAEEAGLVAEEARRFLGGIVAAGEDSPEDLEYRLRDPRTFGEFAASILHSRALRPSTRVAIAERAFDLLPLPRAEGDVILVATRAPPRLLDIAAFLVEEDAFGVLPLMYLVFAVFLDRALVTAVTVASRRAVLRAVLGLSDASPRTRTLYAGMHLATIPQREAMGEARSLLRSRGTPSEVKPPLARLLASADGEAHALVDLAREEGLLASTVDVGSPEVVATVPRLPPALADIGRRWLARAGAP